MKKDKTLNDKELTQTYRDSLIYGWGLIRIRSGTDGEIIKERIDPHEVIKKDNKE